MGARPCPPAASRTSDAHRWTVNLRTLARLHLGANADERNRLRHAILQRLTPHAERIRMLGSAAIDLAWVASARLDASVMLANKAWDVTAG